MVDKQKNAAIYKQKRMKLCVIPLCIIAVRWIFNYVRKFLPAGRILNSDGLLPEWHYEWYFYAYEAIETILSLAAIVCVFILIAFIIRRNRRCKNCMAWESIKMINEKLVDVKDTIVQKTAYSEASNYSASGKYIGYTTIETPYYVPGKKLTYLQTYQCSCCGDLTYKQVAKTKAI